MAQPSPKKRDAVRGTCPLANAAPVDGQGSAADVSPGSRRTPSSTVGSAQSGSGQSASATARTPGVSTPDSSPTPVTPASRVGEAGTQSSWHASDAGHSSGSPGAAAVLQKLQARAVSDAVACAQKTKEFAQALAKAPSGRGTYLSSDHRVALDTVTAKAFTVETGLTAVSLWLGHSNDTRSGKKWG